jgi:hypothetical protein
MDPCRDQNGIGIAMLILIDNAVSVTTRHNEIAPSASEAATASASLEEATGWHRPLKPAALGDRFMVGNPLLDRANHPHRVKMLQSSPARLRQRPCQKMAE